MSNEAQIVELYDISEKDYVIRACDQAFPKPIDMRLNYKELLNKIHNNGVFFVAWNRIPLGYAAMYANDMENKTAFITLLAVRPENQGMHLGEELMTVCFEKALALGMKTVRLEVRAENQRAVRFYQKLGFTRESASQGSIFMQKTL